MSDTTFPDLNEQSSSDTTTLDVSTLPDYYKVSPGSLASIVIGVSLFWIMVGACLFCNGRSRRLKRHEKHRRVGVSYRLDGEEIKNVKSMSFCMYDPESMMYIDGRPDISPLEYENNVLDYAGLTEEELSRLEPENHKPLLLFSGQFTSSVEEKLITCQNGYATRNFTTIEHQTVTVHYFRADRLDWFVNSVYSVMCLQLSPQFTIQHIRAIVLNSPTPKNRYQYLWITSCIMQHYRLNRILYQDQLPSYNIYMKDVYFQSRSIYSILKAVELLHLNRLVHLNINFSTIFYDDTKATTSWKISCFTSVQRIDSNIITHHQPNNCTAPELLLEPEMYLANPKIDSWSVGCVLYALVTGVPLFQSAKEIKERFLCRSIEQYIETALSTKIENDFFKHILLLLLKESQAERRTVTEVLQFCDAHFHYQ